MPDFCGALARSSRMRAETPRRSRPLLARGRSRRNVSIAQDRQALGRAGAWPLAFAWFSCSRPMSRSVSQPFADDAAQGPASPLNVVNAQGDPLVISEVELSEIPLQVLLA